jgi:hypothetical protein
VAPSSGLRLVIALGLVRHGNGASGSVVRSASNTGLKENRLQDTDGQCTVARGLRELVVTRGV